MFINIKSAIKKAFLFLLVAFLSFNLFGCAILPVEREPLPPPLVEPPQIRFNLHTVARGDIVHQVIGAGIFVPVREYTLSFLNNAGRLEEVHVLPGAEVIEGQVLAELESEQLEFDLSQMEINLKQELLRLDIMQLDHNRMDENRRQLRILNETYPSETNKSALADSNHQIARFEIELQIHKLNIERLETNIERATTRLNAAMLKSPINGLITSSNRLVIGDWINAYQNVFTVSDPEVLFLRYSPAVLTGFEVGMKVLVEIEGLEYTGTIVMTPDSESLINAENPTFEGSIIIEVESLPQEVRPGDDASIRVIFQERRNVITIPRSALRTMGARNYVIVRRDEVNREVDIELGIQTPTLVEVIDGLEPGEEIVLR